MRASLTAHGWFAAFLVILATLGLTLGAWNQIAGWLVVIGGILSVVGLAARDQYALALSAALLVGAAVVAVWQGGSWRWFILPAFGIVGWFLVQAVGVPIARWLERRGWRRNRKRRGALPPFSVPDDARWTDALVLVALANTDDGDGAVISDVINAWDYVNRSIPDREDVEHGVRVLAAGGLVTPRDNRLFITEAGRRVYDAMTGDDLYEVSKDVGDALAEHADSGIALADWSLPADVWADAQDAYFAAIDAR
jgi:hypothetical protein